MPTTIRMFASFEKSLSKLRRKYPKVIDVVDELIAELRNDNRPGDIIPEIGFDVYKVRLPNPSASRGKSGGFRVIYYVQVAEMVVLLTIYSKTGQADISPAEIRRMLDDLDALDMPFSPF
jgi:mRNA-degrading endonuclease RelE of RelBE toxin-antitoxin system